MKIEKHRRVSIFLHRTVPAHQTVGSHPARRSRPASMVSNSNDMAAWFVALSVVGTGHASKELDGRHIGRAERRREFIVERKRPYAAEYRS